MVAEAKAAGAARRVMRLPVIPSRADGEGPLTRSIASASRRPFYVNAGLMLVG